MTDSIDIAGGCHCGNIRYALTWPRSGNKIPARECGCSFCRKHGGAWTSNPDAGLEVVLKDSSGVSRYRFGTRTADFYICSCCGSVPLVLSEIDATIYAVVNTNTFENRDSLTFDRSPTDFDGEDTGTRLGRRKRNWIADVHVSTSGD